MKLKLLLAILLLPLSLQAANTNVFDRVLIRNDFQFTGGSFGLNKVLTSDAAGIYTPQTVTSLGPFAVTNGANLFLSTNSYMNTTFGAGSIMRVGVNNTGNGFINMGDGAAAFNINMGGGTTNMFSLTPTTATLGFNSGTSYTFPGSTMTAANGMNWNANTLWLGSAGNVALGTNNTSQAQMTFHLGNTTTGLLMRANAAGSGFPLIIQSTTGASHLFGVSVGGQLTWGASASTAMNASSLSLIAAGLETLIRNNTSTANSGIQLQGGNTASGYVRIDGGSAIEQVRVSAAGLSIGVTNVSAGRVPIQTSGATNFIVTSGNILTLSAYVTNMSVVGAVKGCTVINNSDVFTSGLTWGANCTNNGVVTAYIYNGTAGTIDPGVHTNNIRFFCR